MLRVRTIPLATVSGCDLRLDPALILAGLYMIWGLATRYQVIEEMRLLIGLEPVFNAGGWALIVVLGTVVCLLIHEAAHLAVARSYGAHPRRLVFSFLGGKWEHARGDTRAEWRVALAGPLVSISIGAGVLTAVDGLGLRHMDVELALSDLGMFQVVFGLLNLIPVFPFDGGRIVHGLTARRLGSSLATRIPMYLGMALAILCVAAAIAFSLVPLFFVALFLWANAMPQRAWPQP
jgi:Zn-dependent protease